MNLEKIGFDAKRLLYNSSGLGNYSRTLVKNLNNYFPELELILLAPEKSPNPEIDIFDFKDLKLIQPTSNLMWRYAFMNKDIKKLGINIYHGLSNELPYGIERISGLKKIVTIHDLIFLIHPEWYPGLDKMVYAEKFKRACITADKIIAISENTKQDIIKFFKTPEEKIEVIYQACDDIYYSNEQLSAPVLGKQGDRPYFLFVSSISKRKNLQNVIEALRQIPKMNRPLLVVVGGGGKEKLQMIEWVNFIGLNEDVEFVNFVTKEKLKALYQNAAFSIYPSFYEGFGIPIVESILSGTPVLVSKTSSMPEAGLDIADYVDPNSINEIKVGLEKMQNIGRISERNVKKVKEFYNPLGLTKKLLSFYQT